MTPKREQPYTKTQRALREPAGAARPAIQDLNQLLDSAPGKLQRIPVQPEDVGGELVAILSRGLYTNPLDCLREYVQNAVDANAHHVTIKITNNSVTIFDEGDGMDLAGLLQARQFGLSAKRLDQHVGFRGIGIYSGFDLCRRLRISTKLAGDNRIHVLVFEFADMRARLDAERGTGGDKPKTALLELLSSHTGISREPTSLPSDKHFTQVELQDISDDHIRQLSNRAELKRHLLQNLPIDFEDAFEYREQINAELGRHVPGFNAIRITLQSPGLADQVVEKHAIPGLQPPQFGYITTSDGKQVAYYWACLNKKRWRIGDNKGADEKPNKEWESYEGFVYKVKGFTVGDRSKLGEMFQRQQVYWWYTGEIFVLDRDVIPNAERNDFETNPARRALDLAVRGALDALEDAALKFQAEGVAAERIEKYEKEIARISGQVDAPLKGSSDEERYQDPWEVFSRLDRMREDLARQKKAAPKRLKNRATRIETKIKELQRNLREQTDKPTAVADQRRQQAKRGIRKGSTRGVDTQPDSLPPPTLADVFRSAGWSVGRSASRLLDALQTTLEAVMPRGGALYTKLVVTLESVLASNDPEPPSA